MAKALRYWKSAQLRLIRATDNFHRHCTQLFRSTATTPLGLILCRLLSTLLTWTTSRAIITQTLTARWNRKHFEFNRKRESLRLLVGSKKLLKWRNAGTKNILMAACAINQYSISSMSGTFTSRDLPQWWKTWGRKQMQATTSYNHKKSIHTKSTVSETTLQLSTKTVYIVPCLYLVWLSPVSKFHQPIWRTMANSKIAGERSFQSHQSFLIVQKNVRESTSIEP